MSNLKLSTQKRAALHESLTIAWIDRLFGRFEAYYGARFADAWRGTDVAMVKYVWLEKLGELTREEIIAGVAQLECCKFPPTLPEFFALCRPAPDYESLHYEAVAQTKAREQGTDEWASLALFWAARRIGAWDLMTLPYVTVKTRWRSVYDKAVDEMRAGILPDILSRSALLPAPGKTVIPADVMRKRIADLKTMLISGSVASEELEGITKKSPPSPPLPPSSGSVTEFVR